MGSYNNLLQAQQQRTQILQEGVYGTLLQKKSQVLLKCLRRLEEIQNGQEGRWLQIIAKVM